MRAAVLHRAKDLRLEEVAERPLEADEVRVRFGAGGICGSDLSYFFKGRVGDFQVVEPLVLGHEVAGEVIECGADVRRVQAGDRVAVDPSRPCLICAPCRAGRSNLCRNMRFMGSAAVVPHVQGAFAETIVAREDQCHPVPADMPFETAACSEPLSCALHALSRADGVLGRDVIVTGAGPIGCLVVACARLAGAARITVTDLIDAPLAVARAMGADETINISDEPDRLAAFAAGKGRFDLAFEATGVLSALASLIQVTGPGGCIVQVGILPPGEVPVAVNAMMAKEIAYQGSFRFHREFADAVTLLATGRLDVGPIQTQRLPLGPAAFETAADRRQSIKVHVHF